MAVSDHYENVKYGLFFQNEGHHVLPHDELAKPIEDAIKGFLREQTQNMYWEVRWTRNYANMRIDLKAQTTINGKFYKARTYSGDIEFSGLDKRVDPIMYIFLAVIECLEIIFRRMILKFRSASYHEVQQEIVGHMNERLYSRKLLKGTDFEQ